MSFSCPSGTDTSLDGLFITVDRGTNGIQEFTHTHTHERQGGSFTALKSIQSCKSLFRGYSWQHYVTAEFLKPVSESVGLKLFKGRENVHVLQIDGAGCTS
jgi:hypothetical protein